MKFEWIKSKCKEEGKRDRQLYSIRKGAVLILRQRESRGKSSF